MTGENKKQRILLIDDSPTIRVVLGNLFKQEIDDVEVDLASGGKEAIECVTRAIEERGENPYDWIWCDIEMPDIDGFETLRRIRQLCPNAHFGMISGANIDQYLSQAYNGKITNIISKVDSHAEIVEAIRKYLFGQGLIGLENYMSLSTPMNRLRIFCIDDVDKVIEDIIHNCLEKIEGARRDALRLCLMEIISNAIRHAYGCSDEDVFPRELDDSQIVTVGFAVDEEKLGVGISDHSGTLKKEKVLERLAMVANPTEEELWSVHGRGLFITRAMADKVVINIKTGALTEVLLFFYFDKDYKTSKPLIVNEL